VSLLFKSMTEDSRSSSPLSEPQQLSPPADDSVVAQHEDELVEAAVMLVILGLPQLEATGLF
jgi:hypothetical protein